MTKQNQKQKKSNKKKLIIMSVITVLIIGTYLYIQFDDNFDPVYVTDIDSEDPYVKQMTVETHLKNGIEDYFINIGSGVNSNDDPKIVEELESEGDNVEGLTVETKMGDGTKKYTLHITEDIGAKEKDLIEYQNLIKDGTCEQLEELLQRTDFKSDAFRKATQEEYDSRCL